MEMLIQSVHTEHPVWLFKQELLATMLAFVILHRAEQIRTPSDWLFAQLNGGASFIKGMSCFCR